MGSGVVFLNTSFKSALLCDVNPDLVAIFTRLQHEGSEFIRHCKEFFSPATNTEDVFYKIRDDFNSTEDPQERAPMLLYLNRHAFNGLVRYNSKRKYNVPFGRYKSPYFPEDELLFFFQKMQNSDVQFSVQDFRETFTQAQCGDVFYCDPPYVPLSASSSFTTYAGNTFEIEDQKQLAECAEVAARNGYPTLISNHDTPETRSMYHSGRIYEFKVQRSISCQGNNRHKAAEILALFHSNNAKTRLNMLEKESQLSLFGPSGFSVGS